MNLLGGSRVEASLWRRANFVDRRMKPLRGLCVLKRSRCGAVRICWLPDEPFTAFVRVEALSPWQLGDCRMNQLTGIVRVDAFPMNRLQEACASMPSRRGAVRICLPLQELSTGIVPEKLNDFAQIIPFRVFTGELSQSYRCRHVVFCIKPIPFHVPSWSSHLSSKRAPNSSPPIEAANSNFRTQLCGC